jgi:hypothetical protein
VQVVTDAPPFVVAHAQQLALQCPGFGLLGNGGVARRVELAGEERDERAFDEVQDQFDLVTRRSHPESQVRGREEEVAWPTRSNAVANSAGPVPPTHAAAITAPRNRRNAGSVPAKCVSASRNDVTGEHGPDRRRGTPEAVLREFCHSASPI